MRRMTASVEWHIQASSGADEESEHWLVADRRQHLVEKARLAQRRRCRHDQLERRAA